MELVAWARDLARCLLAEPLPRRWAHTQGVAGRAEEIAHVVGDQSQTLVAVAWLHDIGYAPALLDTGLHPLDGARYLRDVVHADDGLCRLVAHHSCALVEARHRGLADALAGEFPPVDGLILEALTYCDMTTSPDGHSVEVGARLDEVLERYGEGDVVTAAIGEARARIMHTAQTMRALVDQRAP